MITALSAAVLVAAPVAAQEPGADGASSSFTFKRVKPPKAGARKLINIQVEEKVVPKRELEHVLELPDQRDPEGPTVARLPDTSDSHKWFWGQMSPRLADAGYGKMAQALRVLAQNPGDSVRITPDEATIARIVRDFGGDILKATVGTEISPALVVAVIATESAGRPKAKSSAGARGLMQLMPATAERFGVSKVEDPAENISGGVKYLAFLLDRFKGDALLALAGYNAGEGAVDKAAGVPDYRETRGYVPKVVAAWGLARQACLTPPNRATDGCLFRGLQVARN
ncbi:lytic transglycosylase domain-containing protein [Algicella marina]|uniref:Transglycosylase SLT domain-containing protein n=1 Tax=Algicella marina TaxID=2683284 RepID=A0A6P1SVI6_9RHOB|nr:lytic transglycosylase domain-containing protein [Algicella marina]QHQ33670.1 transglycosylase SLT domain-containing protein [Algicella marina]